VTAPFLHSAAGAEIDEGRLEGPSFDIDGVRKDLTTTLQVARDMGRDLPITAKALEC
jgi:3-hydroxyisobutyrate dehydrogenase-like beta-hydroxyacid dehydrogenase